MWDVLLNVKKMLLVSSRIFSRICFRSVLILLLRFAPNWNWSWKCALTLLLLKGNLTTLRESFTTGAGGTNQTDLIKQNSRTTEQCQQSKTHLEGQVKHPAVWSAARPFGERVNSMRAGFKIIKCMIYWKKKHRRERSAHALKRGGFFKYGALLWTSLHGSRYTCTAAWLLPNSQSVSSSHGSQKSMSLLFCCVRSLSNI